MDRRVSLIIVSMLVSAAGMFSLLVLFSPLSKRAPAKTIALTSVDKRGEARAPVIEDALVSTAGASRLSPAIAPSGWREFSKKFGTDLEPEFTAEGRLISVRGKPGRGLPTSGKFDTNDPQAAIARAREIVETARGLLGFDSKSPVENPIARVGAFSAQVEFQQVLDHVPVSPGGLVVIDLGPRGELLGLNSDYVPGVSAGNRPSLSAEELRGKAQEVVVTPNEAAGDRQSPKAEGGAPVIWLSSRSSPGRYAYTYWVQGRQVVVDASSGEVLFKRDRRRF